MDNRLTLTEDRVATFMAQSRGIVSVKPTIATSTTVTDFESNESKILHRNYEDDLQEDGEDGDGGGEDESYEDQNESYAEEEEDDDEEGHEHDDDGQ